MEFKNIYVDNAYYMKYNILVKNIKESVKYDISDECADV